MTTPIEPNILAFQNADILAALQDAGTPRTATTAWTKRSLAAHVSRDESNVAKTLKRLTEEGLLLSDPMAGLTDAGRAQLAAFNRARHGGERRKAQGRWRAAGMQRNPLNRPVDRQHVHDIAETIEAAGDVLVPIVVSPPDAHGVRTIWAGEHRWEAVKYLTNLDRCPEVLKDDGILFTEREATPGEAAVIALIENSTRRDLTPWQDAQQLKAAADGLNLNASDLARRIGRASEGSRGGLRDVQVKLKVAREASPEAIQAYTADPSAPGAWERLRDSVSEKKAAPEIVLTKAQRLALAELFARAGQVVGAEVRVLPAAHTAEGARLAQYGLAILIRDEYGDRARVTQAGADHLQAEGLSYDWSHVAYAREKLGFPGRWGGDKAQTEWLNLPHAPAAPNPDPEVEAPPSFSAATASPPSARGGRGRHVELDISCTRALTELAHWEKRAPARHRDRGHVAISIKAWMNPAFIKLKNGGCIGVLANGSTLLHARVTNSGREVLSRQGMNHVEWPYRTPWLSEMAHDSSEEPTPEKRPALPDGRPLAEVLVPGFSSEVDAGDLDEEAAQLVRAERWAHRHREGWSEQHDDEENGDGELAQAAAAYAVASCGDADAALFWPGGWAPDMFKPTGQIRDLVKAGALIQAEIERRLRAGEAA